MLSRGMPSSRSSHSRSRLRGSKKTVVDAAAQAADAIAPEHADQPQLILGARRQHARAAAQVVVEPALNARLGAAGRASIASTSRRARRPPPAKRSMVAAVKTRA